MLVIDPGHGGKNIGCQANGLVEKDLTLALALQLRRLCVAAGIPVALTREDDGTYSFTRRLAAARGAGATQVLCLHFDANPSPAAGRQTCYCKRSDFRSRDLAERVLRCAPRPVLGATDPVFVEPTKWKRRAYHVVHAFAEVSTLLVECAYLTSDKHAEYLTTVGMLDIAAGIFSAVKEVPWPGNIYSESSNRPRVQEHAAATEIGHQRILEEQNGKK